jgi:hypothetical protein
MPGDTGVFGKNLEPVAARCVVCKKFVAIQVDPEDLARWWGGVLAQDAMPYLSAADRELLCLSNVCGECWKLLCPEPLVYPHEYN